MLRAKQAQRGCRENVGKRDSKGGEREIERRGRIEENEVYLRGKAGRHGSKGGIKLTGSTALSHLFRRPRIMRFPRPSLMLCHGCGQPTPRQDGGNTAMNWPCPLFPRGPSNYIQIKERTGQTSPLSPVCCPVSSTSTSLPCHLVPFPWSSSGPLRRRRELHGTLHERRIS